GVAEFAETTEQLTQNVMTSDRMLGGLAALSDPWQPAVPALIGTAAAPAQALKTSAGGCGAAAAGTARAGGTVGPGDTRLSMAARALPAVAEVLRTVTLDQAQQTAKLALGARTAQEAKTTVRGRLPVLDELGL